MTEGDDLRYGSRGQRRIEAGDELVITYHDPDFTDTGFRAGLGMDIEDNGTDVESGQIPSLLIYDRSAREVEERPRKRARARANDPYSGPGVTPDRFLSKQQCLCRYAAS